ncbi:hypothetical protein Bca101_066775 [Brassica carinata]
MARFRSRFLGFGQIHFALGGSCCWFSVVGVCEEPLLSVLSPELRKFMWQHVMSQETASASPCWSLFSGFSLAIGLPASPKVVFSRGGLEAAISTSPPRTTAPPVSVLLLVLLSLGSCRSLSGASRFRGAFLSGSSRQPSDWSAHTFALDHRRYATSDLSLGFSTSILNQHFL